MRCQATTQDGNRCTTDADDTYRVFKRGTARRAHVCAQCAEDGLDDGSLSFFKR